MEKQKVTLSLDKDVVREAKKAGINMSRAANKAIKKKTDIEELSSEERDIRNLIQEGREEGKVVMLAFKLKGFEMKDITGFKDTKVDLNAEEIALYGPNESGKTVIVESIKDFFKPSIRDDEFIKQVIHSGEINLALRGGEGAQKITNEKLQNSQCLVIDDLFSTYTIENAKELIDNLKSNYTGQIIITTRRKEVAEQLEETVYLKDAREKF